MTISTNFGQDCSVILKSHMDLRDLQRNWDLFGRKDPMWAILTQEDKKNRKWDKDSFFQTGRKEIRRVMKALENAGVRIPAGNALDFGCGLGRLTQALADHFPSVTGVDIAPSMIEGAIRLNPLGDRCRFLLNDRDDLAVLPDASFAFIYTNITLQHMAPVFAEKYLREFGRLLIPGGILVFQLPVEEIKKSNPTLAQSVTLLLQDWTGGRWTRWLYAAKNRWYRWLGQPVMEMYGMPPDKVRHILEEHGKLQLLDAQENRDAGHHWSSIRYTARRTD